MANQTDWQIRAPADTCSVCGKTYEDGEGFTSRLVFGEEGYDRLDYCGACWDALEDKSALSTWKGVFKAPAPAPEEALKKETAESLLRKFIEDEDESRRNAIFILAVMLERKRILAEQDVQVRDDGIKVRVYEHKKTGETFLVPDPGLKLNELEHVQEEVVVLLGGQPPGRAAVNGESSAEPDEQEASDEEE